MSAFHWVSRRWLLSHYEEDVSSENKSTLKENNCSTVTTDKGHGCRKLFISQLEEIWDKCEKSKSRFGLICVIKQKQTRSSGSSVLGRSREAAGFCWSSNRKQHKSVTSFCEGAANLPFVIFIQGRKKSPYSTGRSQSSYLLCSLWEESIGLDKLCVQKTHEKVWLNLQ